jgi:hypothetical protein
MLAVAANYRGLYIIETQMYPLPGKGGDFGRKPTPPDVLEHVKRILGN